MPLPPGTIWVCDSDVKAPTDDSSAGQWFHMRSEPLLTGQASALWRMSLIQNSLGFEKYPLRFIASEATSYAKSLWFFTLSVDYNAHICELLQVKIPTLQVTGVPEQSDPTPRQVQRWLPSDPLPPPFVEMRRGKCEGSSNTSRTALNKPR